MLPILRNLKSAVAAWCVLASVALAQSDPPQARPVDTLDDLFIALAEAEGSDAAQIAGKITSEWSKSGSPALDLLLQRGRDAMEDGDLDAAIGHLTALVDHAPRFAEGYNARATAFFNARRFGLALNDIQMVLALNPRHFGAMTGMAIILEDMGEPLAALDAWREVLRYFPASPQATQAVPRLELEVEGTTL